MKRLVEMGNPLLYSDGMDRRLRDHLIQRILSWFERNARDLPWRHSKDPYHIWVSEVMLQQTQVETVIPYYHRFLSRFPTIRSLAEASMDEVLKVWENMGYYARSRHLHSAAQEILAKSPTSIKMLKFAMNLTDDGMVGQQIFAGEATRLAYMTDEAKEGRNAFLEKRKPNFKDVKWIP